MRDGFNRDPLPSNAVIYDAYRPVFLTKGSSLYWGYVIELGEWAWRLDSMRSA